jgi:1,4-dihydroxy-2-naphthoate octaprenyltransferase
MKERKLTSLDYLIAASRPDHLAAALLTYALGAGVVHFLGNPIDWVAYWIGQGLVTLLQLSSAFLYAYFNFDAIGARLRRRQTPESDGDESEAAPRRKDSPEKERLMRLSFLQAGLVALTIGAVLTVMMSYEGRINPLSYFLIGVALAAGLSSAIPPANFGRKGYGELFTTLFLTILTPGLAYALQAGEIHRLLTLMVFPLYAMILACQMALSLEFYNDAGASPEKTLMIRLGWQKGMQFHDLLIFSAYLLFGGAALAGLPWALTWPAILSLPVGLFQIWQMRQISTGVKPQWKLLKWTAYGLAIMTVYLISLALWTS